MNIKQKERRDYKHGELKDIVLSAIGISLVVGGSIVFPNLPIVLGIIVGLINESKTEKIPENKIIRVMRTLEKRNIINLIEIGDQVSVEIKDKKNIIILKYSIKQLLDLKKKKQKWMRKWFMVLFDVPEKQRNKRDYLRNFLLNIGFYPYQKSVYIFPYECSHEIELIKKITESNKYMSYIIADKIEFEDKAKIFFNL